MLPEASEVADHIQHLEKRLVKLYPAPLQGASAGASQEERHYLCSWVTPAVLALVDQHGVVLKPERVVFNVGVPLRCHENALAYATRHSGCLPWFGFALSLGQWWLHSFVVEEGGGVVDSGPETELAMYFGLPWCLELFRLVGGTSRPDLLPPVLARSMSDLLLGCSI